MLPVIPEDSNPTQGVPTNRMTEVLTARLLSLASLRASTPTPTEEKELERRQRNVKRNLAKFMRDEQKLEDRRMRRRKARNMWERAGLGSCWV